MTKTALKKKLIKGIENLNNEEMLQELMKMVNLYSEMDEIIQLSPKQKVALNKSIEDVKKGKVISSAKANKEINKWLRA